MRYLAALCLLVGCWSAGAVKQHDLFDPDMWRHEGVGKIVQVANAESLALVGSALGVVAGLNPLDGSVVWRQVLPEAQPINTMSTHGKYTLVLSGRHQRMLDSLSGLLLWESQSFHDVDFHHRFHGNTSSAATSRSSTVIWFTGKKLSTSTSKFRGGHVAFFDGEQVLLRSSSTGKIVWKRAVPPDMLGFASASDVDIPALRFFTQEQSSHLIRMEQLDARTGTSITSLAFDVPCAASLANTHIFASGGLATLCSSTVHMYQADGASSKISLKKLTSDKWTHLSKAYPCASDTVLMAHSREGLVARVLSNGNTATISESTGEVLGFLNDRMVTVSETSLKVGDTTSIFRWNLQQRGGITHACSADTACLYLLAEDDSFSCVNAETSEVVWTREESLASLEDILFLDPPIDYSETAGFAEDDSEEVVFPSWWSRLRAQANSIVSFFCDLPILAVDQMQSVSGVFGLIEQEMRTADQDLVKALARVWDSMFGSAVPGTTSMPQSTAQAFGFDKLIVGYSGSGKLVAISSLDGAVVWGTFVGTGVKGLHTVKKHSTPTHPAQMVVVHADHALTVDIRTGVILSRDQFKFEVLHTTMLPAVDDHHHHIVALVDSRMRVHTLPASAARTSAIQEHISSLYFHDTDVSQGVVRTYRVSSSFEAVHTWQMSFPPTERLVANAASSPEAVQSVVALIGGGDGGIEYRYINPHLVVFATRVDEDRQAQLTSTHTGTLQSGIALYLVDLVRGAVLERSFFAYAQGPVSLAVSENMVLASFYNSHALQNQLVVLELFEDQQYAQVNADRQYWDSLSMPKPVIRQQRYVLARGVTAMGSTSTRHGISTKNILLGLTSDQLLTVPRSLFNTRRVVGAKQPEWNKKDGIPPYSAYLPYHPHAVVSQHLVLPRMRGIISTGSKLESSSLVCSFGVDVWFRRLSPSNSFDMLSEEFNKPLLLATVSAVFIGIVVTTRMSKAKRLRDTWR